MSHIVTTLARENFPEFVNRFQVAHFAKLVHPIHVV